MLNRCIVFATCCWIRSILLSLTFYSGHQTNLVLP
ncbi:Uncharacterised protein [Vibrio cholerae]|nr:Uncharacterised protein [Vibrio cholerae]